MFDRSLTVMQLLYDRNVILTENFVQNRSFEPEQLEQPSFRGTETILFFFLFLSSNNVVLILQSVYKILKYESLNRSLVYSPFLCKCSFSSSLENDFKDFSSVRESG